MFHVSNGGERFCHAHAPNDILPQRCSKRIDWLLWWRLQVLAQQPPCGEQDKKTGTICVTHPFLGHHRKQASQICQIHELTTIKHGLVLSFRTS
jgi:hypothetical protein